MRLNLRHAATFASIFRFIDDVTAIDDGEEIEKRRFTLLSFSSRRRT